MNISWVFSDKVVLDPLVDLERIKAIGPSWGSWRTWRSCQTDNVICHNLTKATELLKRNFQDSCNFYIPNESYTVLNRPERVNLYEGSFIDEFQPEEIVAMHLASGTSDIVLLVGFDLTEKAKLADKLQEHRAHVYRTLVKHVVEDNPEVQWVLVDHPDPVMKMLSKLPNLTSDSLKNCLELTDI